MKRFPKLKSPAILSPMAGVTDVAFRALCKRYGAGMTCTEFVSSAALVRDSKRTWEMLRTDPSEKPVAVQLFGTDTDEVVAAAKLVEKKFDVIDMNCGCPAWKVIKTGAGSALLNEPRRIAELVEAVSSAVKKPVTIKIRAGIDKESINAVAVAKAAEAAGAAAVAVHGRTQQQGYASEADWSIVKAVKHAVSIPVIGNGDVFSAADFWRKKEESGCDYIMVARGAIGNPAIFAEINEEAKKGDKKNTIRKINHKNNKSQNNTLKDIQKAINSFLAYHELALHYSIPFGQVKGHAISFTKGVPGGARLRERLTRATTHEELLTALRDTPTLSCLPSRR